MDARTASVLLLLRLRSVVWCLQKRLQSVPLESRSFPQVTNHRPVLLFSFFFLFVCFSQTQPTHSLTLNYVEPFCHLQQYVAQLSCRYSELRLLNGADLTGVSGGLFTYFCQAASNGPLFKMTELSPVEKRNHFLK